MCRTEPGNRLISKNCHPEEGFSPTKDVLSSQAPTIFRCRQTADPSTAQRKGGAAPLRMTILVGKSIWRIARGERRNANGEGEPQIANGECSERRMWPTANVANGKCGERQSRSRLENAAPVDHPPAHEHRGQALSDAPPKGQKESSQAQQGEQEPKCFLL